MHNIPAWCENQQRGGAERKGLRMSMQRQGETGRLAVLAAVAIAFVAGVFFMVNQFSGTSAQHIGPNELV